MNLIRSLFLVALFFGCAAPSTPRSNGGTTPETILPAPSGVRSIQDASTANVDGATKRPCLLAEANLQRLQCRPEGFTQPGADRFAVLCDRMGAIRHVDAACLANASTLAAVRACRSGVQCADSPAIERTTP